MPAIETRLAKLLLCIATSAAGCVGRVEPQGYPGYTGSGGSGGSDGLANGAQGGTGGSTSEVSGDGYCRVQSLLDNHCGSCHSSSPPAAVPVSLVTYDDLMAPAPSDASLRVIDVSLARMQSTTKRMPPAPAPALPQEDLAFIEQWLQEGAPANCDAAPEPGIYDTPSVCTSDSYWTHGNDESPKMHPGRACIACHSGSLDDEGEEEEEGPRFWLAGTVYPTAHEPDDCNGVDGSDTKVVIVDADGKTLTLNVNSAGNFFYEKEDGKLALPYTAKVVRDGQERAMATAQKDGDCNGCHSENGDNDAPARIMAP